ncbi:MAG: 1,4-dihydroxy-2-naphthoate polyprenyltransferase [Thermoplasmatota archaeon]|nr:1,4-dihydroxy-2-naphthoate polyprenyltransferase [Halobacteriales archaeon]
MTVAAWLSTLRIRTLPAAAVPVLVGAAHAWHLAGERQFAFRWLPAVAALASALLIQVGTNLANDYYDHKKGADTPDRAGPRRASASGLLPPTQVRNAAYVAFLLAAALGVYLVTVGGVPILLIGLAAILSGLLYTAGPKPLGYLGLGDAFVLLFFGPVAVMGTTYLEALDTFGAVGAWMPALFLGIEVGALATAILAVNNLRDLPTDARAGKRTLAVRMGERGTRIEYALLLVLAYLLVVLSYVRHATEWRLLLPLASIPLAIPPLRRVFRPLADRRELNPALGQTGLLLLAFGVLSAVGLAMP